tara:strand:- start:1680 stop:2375 length:696 start_codon:yes stop_codon:yes gene_type:complete
MKNEPQSYSVKFYAEKKLDDGRVIATEDEQFAVGSKVFAISDDGEATSLSAGTYNLEGGDKLVIGDASEILQLGETEVVEDEEVEASKEEELAEESEAEETDWAKTFEEMKDRVAELEKAVFGEKAEEETEELSEEVSEETEENSEETKTEMSSEDVIGELMSEVEELKSKVVQLSGEPATEGINYNPEGTHLSSNANGKQVFAKISKKDLLNMTTADRAEFMISNKLTRI